MWGICFITLEKEKAQISWAPQRDNIENLFFLIHHFLWETETEAYGTQMEGGVLHRSFKLLQSYISCQL